jgi:hypothetical protein
MEQKVGKTPVHVLNDPLGVVVLNNPLKQVVWSGTYTFSRNQKDEQSKFFIRMVKEYMDLSKGIWNVTLDTYIVKSTLPDPVDTVLDVSTNLVSGFQSDQKTNTHESKNVCLGKMFLITSQGQATGGPFEKKWFTVASGREFSNFELHIKQNPLAVKPKDHGIAYNLDFEITLLFQRIK